MHIAYFRDKKTTLLPIILPVVDFVLVIFLLLLALNTLTGRTLGKIYKSSYALDQIGDDLSRRLEETKRLDSKTIGVDIPASIADKPNKLDAMIHIPASMEELKKAALGVSTVENQVWTANLKHLAEDELRFWNDLKQGLCDSRMIPAVPDTPADSANPTDWALFVRNLKRWEMKVWEQYLKCQEPVPFIIGEDLLHFKIDKWDLFENNLDTALRIIYENVDKILKSHSQIYVFGHTDPSGGDKHNEDLSFHRAQFVAEKIRQHLVEKNLHESVDFALYPVGMGRYKKPDKEPDKLPTESIDDYYKRLRRIEISFRSAAKSSVGME